MQKQASAAQQPSVQKLCAIIPDILHFASNSLCKPAGKPFSTGIGDGQARHKGAQTLHGKVEMQTNERFVQQVCANASYI